MLKVSSASNSITDKELYYPNVSLLNNNSNERNKVSIQWFQFVGFLFSLQASYADWSKYTVEYRW